MMKDKEILEHPFAPVYNENSKIMILGTFPSVKSRENAFYYGHGQNRFWKVLAAVFDDTLPSTVDEKTAFLLRHSIAIWDVLASCEIKGSADSTIKRPIPNPIGELLLKTKIKTIFANGKKAKELYDKYILPDVGVEAVVLPSTSPANAAWHLDDLVEAWNVLKGN